MKKKEKAPLPADIDLYDGQIITIGEIPQKSTDSVEPMYYGKLLYETRDLFFFAILMEENQTFKFEGGEPFFCIFTEAKNSFGFNAVTAAKKMKVNLEDYDLKSLHEMVAERKEKFQVKGYCFKPVTFPAPYQRREYFRLPLRTEIYYKIYNGTDEDNIENPWMMEPKFFASFKTEAEGGILEEEAGFARALTEDLSAGGFRCINEEPLKRDTLLNCVLITDVEAVPLNAKIISSKPLPHTDNQFNMRATFVGLSETMRDRIVQYIFREQRKMMKRYVNRN